MSTFLEGPTFNPAARGIPLGTTGQVLTMVGGVPRFAAGGGGGGGVGTYALSPLTTGVFNNAALAAGVGRTDYDTTSGDIELTGLDATFATDGQFWIARNIGVNTLKLDALNAGSLAANRFDLIAQILLPARASKMFCYYAGTINKWVAT